jgi:hypothetical protein
MEIAYKLHTEILQRIKDKKGYSVMDFQPGTCI